jgi:hypothetical protein
MGNVMATVIDTPDGIAAFAALQRYYALKLEIAGLKHSHGSVYALIKRETGLKGNKQRVFEQYEVMLKEAGILRD